MYTFIIILAGINCTVQILLHRLQSFKVKLDTATDYLYSIVYKCMYLYSNSIQLFIKNNR